MYGYAEIIDNKIVLKTKWTPDYQKVNIAIKMINGYKFNLDKKVWEFPLSSWADLILFYSKYKIEISKELSEYIQSQAVEIKSENKDLDNFIDNSPLFTYQKNAAKRLIRNPRCGLFFPMGVGKTITSLFSIPKDSKVLVMCPKVVTGVWKKETIQWRPDFNPIVLKEFRLPEINEVVIINYERLPNNFVFPNDIYNDIYCIADEIQACKNKKSQKTEKVMSISSNAKCFWGLTGTPLSNKPMDLWTVLEVVGIEKKTFGCFDNFKTLFNATTRKFKSKKTGRTVKFLEWGLARSEVAEYLAKTCIVINKKEALPDLPEKIYTYIPIDINGEMKDKLDDLENQWDNYLSLNSKEKEILPPFSMLSKQMNENAIFKIQPMLDLVEMYEESEEKLIVFSAHLEPLRHLKDREGWDLITGETKNRDDIVEKFQKGELKGLGISIKAGGIGITLTAASKAIFVDLEWNPSDNEQAEDRLHRKGQKNNCEYIFLMLDHPLERRLNKILSKKRGYKTIAIDRASKYQPENISDKNDIQDLIKSLEVKEKVIEPKRKTIVDIAKNIVKDPLKFYNGTFTLIKDDSYKVYKIYSQDISAMFAPGQRILAVQTGKDNENDFTSIGFIDDDGVRIFNKRINYKSEAELFWDVLIGKNKDYKIEECRYCLICNKKLTTPDSINIGIGPTCLEKGF